jgi:hypothetical protein
MSKLTKKDRGLAVKRTTGKLTGRTVTIFGLTLPEAVGAVGGNSQCQVDGIDYYVSDFAGVFVGSRTCRGEDYGGNVVRSPRAAPGSTIGIAAPFGCLPVRKVYGAPEIFFSE